MKIKFLGKNNFNRIFAAIFVLSAALFPAAAFEAEVVSVSGKAQVSSNGGASWSEIRNGDRIQQGALIQTAFKSELALRIKGSSVQLGPMSRVKIEELSESGGKDNTRISMDVGSLKSNVKKVEDRRAGFTVRGPAATASVRGTEFEYSVAYKGAAVQVSEGNVAVWKTGSSAAPASDAEGAEGDSPALNGNDAATAQNISDGQAPAGAWTVSVGQTAAFEDGGRRELSAAKNASERAFNLGGAVGNMAAAEMMGGMTGGPDSMNAGFGSGPMGSAGAGTSSLRVLVKFASEP